MRLTQELKHWDCLENSRSRSGKLAEKILVVIQILLSTAVERDIVSHPHVIKADPSTAI